MSDFCCSDDFNGNNNFDYIDGRIYNAFITMVLDGNEPPTTGDLLSGYNSIYADAQLTINDIDHLPRLVGDCATPTPTPTPTFTATPTPTPTYTPLPTPTPTAAAVPGGGTTSSSQWQAIDDHWDTLTTTWN